MATDESKTKDKTARRVPVEALVIPLWKDFEGHTINLRSVVAVEKVKSFSVGLATGCWQYGFKIKLANNNIKILCREPNPNCTREEYKEKADGLRTDFTTLLKAV